jgi:hypothetical protein
MNSRLASIVDISQVSPYVNHVVYTDPDNMSEDTHETDHIRDDILMPAMAQYIAEITSDRPDFPEVSPALVETYFDAAMSAITAHHGCPPANTINRTETVLLLVAEVIEEMINLTRVLDNSNEAEMPFSM